MTISVEKGFWIHKMERGTLYLKCKCIPTNYIVDKNTEKKILTIEKCIKNCFRIQLNNNKIKINKQALKQEVNNIL